MSFDQNAPTKLSWDEHRGGPPHADNLLTVPRVSEIFKKTKDLFPYGACGPHDPEPDTHCVVPAAWFELLVRRASVERPEELTDIPMMTRCIKAEFLSAAVDVLIKEGLFRDTNEEGDEIEVEYADIDTLMQRADDLVNQLRDREEFMIKKDDWEWLPPYDPSESLEHASSHLPRKVGR